MLLFCFSVYLVWNVWPKLKRRQIESRHSCLFFFPHWFLNQKHSSILIAIWCAINNRNTLIFLYFSLHLKWTRLLRHQLNWLNDKYYASYSINIKAIKKQTYWIQVQLFISLSISAFLSFLFFLESNILR